MEPGGQGVMTSGEDSGGGRWVGARGDEAEGRSGGDGIGFCEGPVEWASGRDIEKD